jgi:hypothetical protein
MKKTAKKAVDSVADGNPTLRDIFAALTRVPLKHHSLKFAEQIVGRRQPNYLDKPFENARFWAEFRARMRYIEAEEMMRVRAEEQ